MSAEKVEIKIVNDVSEINDLLDLFIKVFSEPPYSEIWSRDSAFKRLSEIYEKGKGFCLYAKENDQVIGLIFCQTQVWNDGVHIIVEDTVVDSLKRRNGIGKLLVQKLEEVALDNNMVSIDLLSNKQAKAIDFWNSLGYNQTNYVQFIKQL